MRLEAVVGKSRVTNTSLCPIGTPARGPAWPAARAASCAWAWPKVMSSSSAKNVPKACWALARCKKCWATSVALVWRLRICAARAAMLKWCKSWVLIKLARRLLFDDFGNQEQALLGRRGVAQIGIALIGLGDHIVLQAQLHVLQHGHGVGQRLDARRIDGLHLRNHAEKIIQLDAHLLAFLRGEFQSRQMGNAVNVVRGEGHSAIQNKTGVQRDVTSAAAMPLGLSYSQAMRYYLAFAQKAPSLCAQMRKNPLSI